MHTGPQYTSTQQQAGGNGGRGAALLIGGIAFAVVFLLIVGATVGYLVLRPAGGGGGSTVTSSSASTSVAPETPSTSETPSPTPTDVEAERCWTPERSERTSTNPSGKLRGGGLQFIPPTLYAERGGPRGIAYANDLQGAQAQVTEDWTSTMVVGAIEWQPGIEYPGAEVASQTIVSCYFSSDIWGGTSGRSLDDEITEPVTIAGLPGYRTTATVNFAVSDIDEVTATELVVVVLETDQGPSLFMTETNTGTAEHMEAADQAYESLTGIS
ncbi:MULTISPECIES: hypothetical protein [unclassified Brachybacterium]|uniref:hypothetical protein n=1 Tax=unclassified Brachybacterium TaxID=2623841 RepID=UPI003F8F41D9